VAEADAVVFTPAEARRIGNDLPLLRALTELGQGRLLAAGEPLPTPPRADELREAQAEPLLLGLSTIAFFAYLLLEGRRRR